MGLFEKKHGSQATHHSGSLQSSAQPLHRNPIPENAQNPSLPQQTEQSHQIPSSITPASTIHHVSKVKFSSHTPAHPQPPKQSSHRIGTLNRALPNLDTHLELPRNSENFSPHPAPPQLWGHFRTPTYQAPSLVPLEAPVSPKTIQSEVLVNFRGPNFQNPHRSSIPDSPVSPLIERPKYPSPPQHSGPPHQSRGTQPLVTSTNSLPHAHRKQPSHSAHSSVQNNRCNTCHGVAGKNTHCQDCKTGLAGFLNATSQGSDQTGTPKCAMCGKPAEKGINRCTECKNKNVEDFLRPDRKGSLHKR
jgi:hypothetical protein